MDELLAGKAVLVVDDVLTNLKVAQGLLRNYGAKVSVAKSGEQALSIIRDCGIEFDAVFLDHLMPDLDGVQTMEKIRTEIDLPYVKSVPIIALSANNEAGNAEMFLQKGFQAYLAKPIDTSKLEEVIRTFISGG